jgi:natural product biosynthesis luciferase-like monooxygenase protein
VTLQTWPAPTRPAIPLWITAGSNPRLFSEAGKRGLNILTHLVAQSNEQLEENCASYRVARASVGHDPAAGVITLMLHTQAGETKQQLLPRLRPVMTDYLRTFTDLSNNLSQPSSSQTGHSERKQAYMLNWGVEKYLNHYGLFGSAQECFEQLVQLKKQGIDEVACLMDFGMPQSSVERSLKTLATLL